MLQASKANAHAVRANDGRLQRTNVTVKPADMELSSLVFERLALDLDPGVEVGAGVFETDFVRRRELLNNHSDDLWWHRRESHLWVAADW